MLENYLNEYIDNLYQNSNINMEKEQHGLFTKKQYYELLKPVVEIVNNYKDYSIEELRNKLYEQSGIEKSVKDFVYKKEMIPGLVFSYGTKNYKETVVVGNRQEASLDENDKLVPAIEKMTDDTIFDLASVTKVFTTLSILKLVQNGIINVEDEIVKYAPEFNNLKGVTIFDLLSFKTPLKTDGRIDRAASKEEAEQILFGISIDNESNNLRPYTDMGAMVLKYVVENVSSMNFYDFINENILKNSKMNDTYVVVPKSKLDRVANTNFDGKYYKDGNFAITTTAPKGIVYDPKAQIMGQKNGVLSGHAGMFSTASDMTFLAKSIINGQIIDDKYEEMMAKNRTGKSYIDDNNNQKYIQYLGFLCYSKNPILADSELFHAMSGKSFASAGWTGTQLTVDPINNLYFFLAGNRSHNRMTFIDGAQKDKVKIDENGKKTIILPDGSIKIDATRFAWDRDAAVVHPALRLVIQYKMLEDIYSYNKENSVQKTKTKYITND